MPEQSDDRSGFSGLSRAFKADPTIENYVRLRRKSPNEEIQVAITGGLEWLYGNEQELAAFQIPSLVVAGALDADLNSISELCLVLMERLIERGEAVKSGGTHLASRGEAISESLVNHLINTMLDSLDWNEYLHIPRDLIVLIRHQIGGKNSAWDKKEKAKQARFEAIKTANRLFEHGIEPSFRKIGEALEVNATTVMRWFPNDAEREAAKQYFELLKSILAEKKVNSK